MAQIDYQFQQKLLETIDKMMKARENSLAFNNCIQGIIETVNSDNTYNIKIKDEIYSNIKATSNVSYVKNDVVWIIKINGKSEYKYIFCKK